MVWLDEHNDNQCQEVKEDNRTSQSILQQQYQSSFSRRPVHELSVVEHSSLSS